MGGFVVSTRKEQQDMLHEIGLDSLDDLFASLPDEVKLKGAPDIPEGISEMEAAKKLGKLADENITFRHIFRGAGAYDHYIPAIVKQITAKEEFLTAYTPYQAEISQGVLQSIFEYQTMMCELTGLDASNASVYDGATAAAEGIAMCRDRKHGRALISATTNPSVIRVVRTYCYGNGMELDVIPEHDGMTDVDALRDALTDDVACVYVQQPNFYGILEDCKAIGDIVHETMAKYIIGVNPISLAILQTPAEYGADIAVGEAQPLGLPLSFGGPYLGFMTSVSSMMRKLPGRIVGETVDTEGRRAYVLTLQAREQHIRREKAGSNICSNQALCALTAGVYLSVMGPQGLKKVAIQSASKAHYLKKRLEEIGFELKFNAVFFNEFVTKTPVPAKTISDALQENGILGGLPLAEDEILWCATEKNSKADIDHMTELLGEVCAK